MLKYRRAGSYQSPLATKCSVTSALRHISIIRFLSSIDELSGGLRASLFDVVRSPVIRRPTGYKTAHTCFAAAAAVSLSPPCALFILPPSAFILHHRPSLSGQPVFLLAAAWLIRDSHFDQSGFNQGIYYAISETCPVCLPCFFYKYLNSDIFPGCFQNNCSNITWDRLGTDLGQTWDRLSPNLVPVPPASWPPTSPVTSGVSGNAASAHSAAVSTASLCSQSVPRAVRRWYPGRRTTRGVWCSSSSPET